MRPAARTSAGSSRKRSTASAGLLGRQLESDLVVGDIATGLGHREHDLVTLGQKLLEELQPIRAAGSPGDRK